jgi:heme/copper-type cytochrome/quinol oxidase subunit 2
MSQNEYVNVATTATIVVVVFLILAKIVVMAVVKYKKHLKDKHGNIPSNQNRSDG